ncbi:MAG: hypothetical protein ACTHMC_22350 [Pseudobacter sp.]|uniref:hypothetical protein n=1 Tax=Pseudobacter sp. TaxID=2045420 RepID=UPI003F7F5CCA
MKQIISAGLLIILFAACTKNKINRPGSASLVIFHGVAGANTMKTVFSTQVPALFNTVNSLLYGTFGVVPNLYSPVAGTHPLYLYQIPDTLQKSEPLFKINLDLPEGSMQSLFLAGTPAAPEYVLVNDEPLGFTAKDSAMGIRFVNLLSDNIPVSINMAQAAPGSEVASLAFKGVTEFRQYAVKRNVADYIFEFRNAATGDIITTFTAAGIANDGKLTPNIWIYKNFAFALVGKMGGTGALAPKITRINYARN